MIVSVEMKSIHDIVMLDTIIDAWKAKWKEEEVKHDDAEDESDDCDDEPEVDADDPEAKAHQEALDKLADALRDCGIANVQFVYSGNVHRCKNRR